MKEKKRIRKEQLNKTIFKTPPQKKPKNNKSKKKKKKEKN